MLRNEGAKDMRNTRVLQKKRKGAETPPILRKCERRDAPFLGPLVMRGLSRRKP